jgi:peptidyl-prolyl cis-trans isomerase D
VGDPVTSPLGVYVIKVTKVTGGGGKTFEQARDELRARVVAEKAADLIDDRSSKIDQLLASGTALDNLPADLGVAAVTGTLDAQGNTAEGKPAPIPGPAALKTALVAAAFAMKPGDPPQLTQTAPEGDAALSYFAVEVEKITPPTEKPFADVADAVKADWTKDAIRREQDVEAARMLGAVQDGQSFEDAATVAGVTIRHLAPVGRAEPVEGVPAPLIKPLFALTKKGEVTMIETPDGFAVAQLTEIQVPDPNADPIGFGQIRDALDKEMAQDIQAVFVTAVRERAKWTVNRKAIDQLAQAE